MQASVALFDNLSSIIYMTLPAPRRAQPADLQALVSIENACFHTDRISPRSFRYFLTKSQAEIWVVGDPVVAYGLVLFHRGTSLARIYSLAVNITERGKGLAKCLIDAMEASAREAHKALYIRLEVADDNIGALRLYEGLGYEPIRRLHHYYEDGHDGIRLEKRLEINRRIPRDVPYFEQTTDFTCGPASLLMAAKKLNPNQKFDQIEELDIWREATTIFMTTGHGGTSPYGLALAAKTRGYNARLWVSTDEVPFLDGVRSIKKKAIIELIHKDFVRLVIDSGIVVDSFPKELAEIRAALNRGEKIILLISTYRLNRKKEPHWIWLVDMDEEYAYFNDPDVDEDQWKGPMDSIYVPIPLGDFAKMIKFGRNQFRAAVLVSMGG
jgi:ribosomal protein S18 acetylase RimI-like enzyme